MTTISNLTKFPDGIKFDNDVIIVKGAGAPTDGAAGTRFDEAGPGSVYLDYTNAQMYINTGTKAVPQWTPAGGAGGGGVMEVANNTGLTIEDGDLVYLSGWDETLAKPEISLADADAAGARAEFVVRVDILDAAVGLAHKTYRETGGLDLAAGAEGDPIYLSTTPGDGTLTDPTNLDPNGISQIVGFIGVVATDIAEYNLNGNQAQFGTNEIQDSAITTAKIAAAAVTAAKLEEGAVTHVKIQLTDANALALATGAGIEVVATPGTDKAILVHNLMIVADAVAGAWVEPSAPDDLVLQYAGGADITGAIESGVLVAADVSVAAYAPVATEVTPEPNVGVNLFNTGSNWTGGNAANTLSVYIAYSVVPTIAFS